MALSLKYNPLSGQFDFVNDSSGGSVTPYVGSFNNTTDWGSASGGYYTITILAATHGKGVSPTVSIFEEISPSQFEQVGVDQVLINGSGDISFRVNEVPDLRFQGKIVIL